MIFDTEEHKSIMIQIIQAGSFDGKSIKVVAELLQTVENGEVKKPEAKKNV